MARKCENCDILENNKYWNDLPPTKHSFFKIMPDDFESHLFIPKKFTDNFKEKLCGWGTLLGPSGNKWSVRMSSDRDDPDRVIISKGWSGFVRDHMIGFRDFLVFTFLGNSSFQVVVFDPSGCERVESHFVRNESGSGNFCSSTLHKQQHFIEISDSDDTILESESFVGRINRMSDRDDSDDDGSEDNNYEIEDENFSDESEQDNMSCFKPSVGRPSSSSSRKSTTPGKMSQMYYKSNRRMLEDGEKYRAIQMAEKHKSRTKYPMVLVTLKPTHVYNGFNMTIPKGWAITHMIEKAHQVKLRVPNSRSTWGVVGCRWTRSQQCQLRKNWPQFVLDNNLEEHDVCAFELIKKSEERSMAILNVYIYRVLDDVVPLTVLRRMV